MVENVIFLLIYIVLIVGLVFLVQWVLTTRLGLAIPAMLMNIVWTIVILVIILLCWRALAPFLGMHGLFPK